MDGDPSAARVLACMHACMHPWRRMRCDEKSAKIMGMGPCMGHGIGNLNGIFESSGFENRLAKQQPAGTLICGTSTCRYDLRGVLNLVPVCVYTAVHARLCTAI